MVYFLVKKGLLYYHCNHWGEPYDLLIIPRPKIDSVMHLAHAHPVGHQLGPQNTLEKIQDRFHWPGMVVEVCKFCQRCP